MVKFEEIINKTVVFSSRLNHQERIKSFLLFRKQKLIFPSKINHLSLMNQKLPLFNCSIKRLFIDLAYFFQNINLRTQISQLIEEKSIKQILFVQKKYESYNKKMPKNIFRDTPNWSYSDNDDKATEKLNSVLDATIKTLPLEIRDVRIITLFDEIRKTPLYAALKTIPKAAMHHLHFDCSEDQQFYAKYIVNDPTVYLGKGLKNFEIGTEAQALEKGWTSMAAARAQYHTEDDFLKAVSNITMMNREERAHLIKNPEDCWDLFQTKISNFFPILGTLHLFKHYVDHILRKYIKNGYTRIEFRSFITGLNQYDSQGNLVKSHPEKKFMEAFDEIYEEIKKQFPFLTVGFIFFGLKMFSPEVNEKHLTFVLEQEWDKTIGIDFVQQEDPWGCIKKYDEIAEKVLAKFPTQNIKKVYHGGETRDHLNYNISTSLKAGSARIGHGIINIIQHPEILLECQQKQICFEKNPCSNLVLGYHKDPRLGTAPLLLGLGIPVSINPDDPGKFGYEDTTMDYFVSLISSNWTLKHLKLVAIHSINHAICPDSTKKDLLRNFNERWDQWVETFLKVDFK